MENQSYSSVLIFRKLKSDADLVGAAEHNSRWKQPPNANPERNIDNKTIIGGDKSIRNLVRERIQSSGAKPRKNGVLALEFIQSAGREFFKNIADREDQWVQAAIDFLADRFGRENVVHVSLHKDETTTHLHAIVVPLVKANYKDGRYRKNHKTREWKLDAKGIFEKKADDREKGVFDRSAALFCQTDFTTSFKFIKKLIAKADPVSAMLANKISQGAMDSFSDRSIKLAEKRKILITEMNKILAGPCLYDEPAIAQLPLDPALRNYYPTGDALYCLNRRLIESAYVGLVVKGEGRPIGNPAAPYMHDMQVKYFELCHKMDPKISAPLYGAKMEHQRLSDFYAALEKALQNGINSVDVQVRPTPLFAPAVKHAEAETERIQNSLDPLIAAAAHGELLRKEVEALKAAIRQANDKNASLKTINDDLRQQMRLIPLNKVMEKLGYQRVPGKQNQFQLPDERIIEISETTDKNSKAGFKDISGHVGLGQMNNRTSGKGAIDLVMFLTGWDLKLTQKWFSENFVSDEVLNVAADRFKEELRSELAVAVTAEQSKSFHNQIVAPLLPDSDKWFQVREFLVADYGLDPQMLNDLRQQSLIDANQHGALVCIKFNRKQVVGGLALGLKPNPLTGAASVYETPGDNGYPFVLGNPQAKMSAVVSSPLDALAFYELSGRNARVLASKSPLPPGIVADLKQSTTVTRQPVFLAYNWSPEDEKLANIMKAQLDLAAVPTTPCRPPKMNDQPKSWGDMLLAAKGKLDKFLSVSFDSIQVALENFKKKLGFSTPSAPDNPDVVLANEPQSR